MGNRTYLKIKILNIENGGFGSDDDFLAFSGDFFCFILPSVNRKIGVQKLLE